MIVHLAAILCAAAIWYLRYDRPGAQEDLRWVFFFWYALTPWSNRRWIYKTWIFNLGCLYIFYYKRQRQQRYGEATEAETRQLGRDSNHDRYQSRFDYNDAWNMMKPVIFPCRTSHTRLFPRKHSFFYSYLFVGIPVGWRGYVSTVLSADLKTLPRNRGQPGTGWFNVDSADYLARGENLHGLQGKLDEYLESQVGPIEDSAIYKVLIVLVE